MQLRHASGLALWLRKVRVASLTAERFARWWIDDDLAPPERTTPSGPVVASLRIPIARRGADARLEAGKRHNIKLAATAFHGVVITQSRPLSFWRALGPASEARGFAWGMELKSGCAVPAVGGGICMLSNALFTVAVELGWHILERHGHSLALAHAYALDATVAYPYVDLRIAPRAGTAVLDVVVRGDLLHVGVHHDSPDAPLRVELERAQRADHASRETQIRRRVYRDRDLLEDRLIVDDQQRMPRELRTCLDCQQTTCKARVELPDYAR